MIIPSYSSGPTPETKYKIYCSYYEEAQGVRFARYLHPSGWKRYCYYFNNKEEAEETFQKYNQSHLSVENWEIEQEALDREHFHEYMLEQWDKDFEQLIKYNA